jgi:hypothetical protein
MDFVCPSCKSDNTQRLSVIYEGGLSNVNTKSRGAAIGFARGGIGLGFGTTKTRGTSQTAASERASPPLKKPYLKPLALFIMGFLVMQLFVNNNKIFGEIVFYAWFAASGGWIYYAFQYNSKTWPSLRVIWDNSYLCNRCNSIYNFSGN